MRRVCFALAVAAQIVGAGMAVAQDQPRPLNAAMEDPVFAKRVTELFGSRTAPSWLNKATATLPVTLEFAGANYTLLLGCETDNCAAQQVVVLYNDKDIYGVAVATDTAADTQELTWLNLANQPESIDLKTILYSAISGSFYNHPTLFVSLAKQAQ